MRGFQNLERWLGENLKVRGAILDGEICCLDEAGRPQFDQLELRSHEAHYNAFDLLWLNGKDLRTLPLVDRKQRLAKILPARPSWVIYLGHVEGRGTELFTRIKKILSNVCSATGNKCPHSACQRVGFWDAVMLQQRRCQGETLMNAGRLSGIIQRPCLSFKTANRPLDDSAAPVIRPSPS